MNKSFNIRDILDFFVYSDRAGSGLQGVPWFCLSGSKNKGARGQKLPKNGPFSTIK